MEKDCNLVGLREVLVWVKTKVIDLRLKSRTVEQK